MPSFSEWAKQSGIFFCSRRWPKLVTVRRSSWIRSQAPTIYRASGTGNVYARSDWSPSAIWAVTQCAPQVVPDHQHLNAGNFVLVRGSDDAIIDPGAYGSLSSLTGNAPTVASPNLPEGYRPSQGPWGEDVGYDWAEQTESGVLVTRCRYADQYRFREVASDVAYAVRDTIIAPAEGDAWAVIIDRVRTGDMTRPLHLRFRTRTALALALAGDVASGAVGGSALAIHRLYSSSGTPLVRPMPVGGCEGVARGQCRDARVAGDEYVLEVGDEAPAAIHVVDVRDASTEARAVQLATGDGYKVAMAERNDETLMVIAADAPSSAAPASSLSYRVPATEATHVVVDAPAGAENRADVSATRDGDACVVTVTARAGTGGMLATPLVMKVSESCAVSAVAMQTPLSPPASDAGDGEELHGGCGCRAGGSSAASALLYGIVLVALGIGERRKRHHAVK